MIANCQDATVAQGLGSGASPALPVSNDEIADRFDEVAKLLEEQAANPFRVSAYRKAAQTLRGLERPVAELYAAEGVSALRKLPGFGESLARSVQQLVRTGRLPLLERLRGDSIPEKSLMTVAGIGPELAARIHHELGIETLAALEGAAHDGRLARVQGMGPKRLRAVRESLAGRFRNHPGRESFATSDANRMGQKDRLAYWERLRGSNHSLEPKQGTRWADHRDSGMTTSEQSVDVAELLSVDQEYREKAASGRLYKVRPQRFNPTGAAWLPILHAQRGPRHYTALYSNTARAHDMGMTRDWVVIYRDDHMAHGQWTIVTSQFGKLKGRRIVRGRERECVEHYRLHAPAKETLIPLRETRP